jgi:hypothetical protein
MVSGGSSKSFLLYDFGPETADAFTEVADSPADLPPRPARAFDLVLNTCRIVEYPFTICRHERMTFPITFCGFGICSVLPDCDSLNLDGCLQNIYTMHR